MKTKTSRSKLFQALPHQLSESIYKWDLTTACVRLDLDEQTVFFDSGEERIVAQLLHRYGLIDTFIEGENLHVLVGDSKATLDFKIGRTFLEYHPLSRRDIDDGLSLEEAGDVKRSRVKEERFPDHRVIHIWKLRQLYELMRNDPEINALMKPEFRELTLASFLEDLKAAKAHGHKIDYAVRLVQHSESQDRADLQALAS